MSRRDHRPPRANYIETLVRAVCPSCSASSRKRSKHYVAGLQVCSWGFYSSATWRVGRYFCNSCAPVKELLAGGAVVEARRGHSVPRWLTEALAKHIAAEVNSQPVALQAIEAGDTVYWMTDRGSPESGPQAPELASGKVVRSFLDGERHFIVQPDDQEEGDTITIRYSHLCEAPPEMPDDGLDGPPIDDGDPGDEAHHNH